MGPDFCPFLSLGPWEMEYELTRYRLFLLESNLIDKSDQSESVQSGIYD